MTNTGDEAKADSLSITLGKDDKGTKAKPATKKDDTKKNDEPTWDEKYPDGVEVAPHSDEPRDDAYPPGRTGKLQALA